MNGDLGDQPKSLLLCRKLVIRKDVLNMGLISEWVEVGVVGQTAKHYESLGYDVPKTLNAEGKPYVKVGTKILVRVEHLTIGSGCCVEVQCDECHKVYTRKYNEYLTQNHNGKMYCKKCFHKVLQSGENAWNYNPDRAENERIRDSYEYREFIKSVLARDNYTCQVCGKREDGHMEVHHLYGFAGFPEYRTDQTQSFTLCSDCHETFHLWHGQYYGYTNKGKCTREQFEEWWGQAIKELEVYGDVLPATKKIYCLEEDKIYNSVAELQQSWNLKNPSSIYAVCNNFTKTRYDTGINKRIRRLRGKYIFWLEDYITMTKQEIDEYLAIDVKKGRSVICLTTGKIYSSILKASVDTNLKSPSQLTKHCKGKEKSAGKLPDGTPLRWMYYDEYLKKIQKGETLSDIKEKADVKFVSPKRKNVICVTTGKVFLSVLEASKYYKIDYSGTSKACNGTHKYCGKLPDGTPLKWMYYKDFLNLPQEEQEEILNQNKDSSITDGSFIM